MHLPALSGIYDVSDNIISYQRFSAFIIDKFFSVNLCSLNVL